MKITVKQCLIYFHLMDAFDYNYTSVSLQVLGVPSLGGTKALWFHSCILCTLITQSELHCELWLNLHYVLCVSSSYQICDSRHILISEFLHFLYYFGTSLGIMFTLFVSCWSNFIAWTLRSTQKIYKRGQAGCYGENSTCA